jgi:hypothetical protein
MATQNVKDFNAVNSVNLINDSFLSVQNGELVRLNGSNVNISGINEITSKNINVTGSFSSVNRPLINGTGVLLQGELDLSVYATVTNLATTGSTLANDLATTGSALSDKIDTLSGNSVLTNGDQTIFGTKYFSNSVYIHDLYVTGTEFIANVENKFVESPYILLNLTGGAVDGGLFFVTGSGLTGVNDYGPIIGFDHSNKFKFGVARRSDDLSILNDIASVQELNLLSGNLNTLTTNLATTGSTLNTKVDNLNEYINSSASNIVFTTGNQIKSGRLIIGNDANSIVDPNSQYTLSLQTNSPATWLEILNNSGVNRGVFFGIQDNDFEQYNWQGGDIRFFTSENPGDGTERLIIKNDGKIGIDTHSPSEKLEVAGNIKASGASFNTRPTVNGTGIILNGEGIVATQISDSTTAGRALLTAATVQEQRTALNIFVTAVDFTTLTGTNGNFQRVYVTANDRKIYVWNGVEYIEVSPNQHARTGSNNIACGETALTQVTTAQNNTAVGSDALRTCRDGSSNVAVGTFALFNNTAGAGNTAVGVGALVGNVGGIGNTAVGQNALFTAAGNQNASALGNGADVTASNQVQLGNSNTTTFAYGAVQDRSDVRDKTDIRNTVLGLEFINSLRPVDFKWDMREDYRIPPPTPPAPDAPEEELTTYAEAQAAWSESVKLANIQHDGTHKRTRYHHGLIAQEVKAVLEDSNVDFGGLQDHSIKGGDDVLSIGYVELIAPLIKAVQELKAEIEILKANIPSGT